MNKEFYLKMVNTSGRLAVSITMLLFFVCVTMAGASFNMIAFEENGCKMPVKTEYSLWDYSKHFTFLKDVEVKYPALVDRYDIGSYSYSIGDLIMYAGALAGLVSATFIFVYNHQLHKMKKELKKK